MSSETDPRDVVPHPPRHAARVDVEGFDSSGRGRDIFFAAVRATRMPMAVSDPRLPDTPLVFANVAFLEMTGYALDEIVGRNCRFLQGPSTDAATVALVREAIQSEREVTVEIVNYRKDGTTFWNALFLTPIKDESGEVVYYFSSQLDVTRRREAESALRQAQKMEALGQLTGGMAHDFNNLLQVILGNVELASARVRALDLDDAKLSRAVRKIRDAARRSGELTQQLLAFARKQQLQGRVVSLNDAASRVADLARGSLGDVELKLQLQPEPWNARIDPTQLESALLNLLVNARDAMPAGGRVWLRSANVEVAEADLSKHGLSTPGRYVSIAVGDEGCGIPPEILPRVMDPFFTTKPATEGTGLGLSMVYGFAKQSGGVATIYSEVGVGTTVRLYFPAVSEAAQPIGTGSPSIRRGGGETVLIVDDRPEVAETAADILGSFGYRCRTAQSAPEAEAILSGEHVDLLLTDLIMPGSKNGVVLAREAQNADPALRVLLMTGFADGGPDRWGGRGYEIVFKPFGADELRQKVRRALDNFAAA